MSESKQQSRNQPVQHQTMEREPDLVTRVGRRVYSRLLDGFSRLLGRYHDPESVPMLLVFAGIIFLGLAVLEPLPVVLGGFGGGVILFHLIKEERRWRAGT